MTAEIIEGEVREIPVERAVVVAQPGQAIVASSADPAAMVEVASRLATVLKDIVERQKLYAVIRNKKYPQVEAWMTIGRLDNVVAREPTPPTRHEDGSYEAFAELVRLSDGMVVGASSALCGTKDDSPWHERSEPARRAMAQTRATSRAFRQQYSWIMALAGYEATPAEEMPHDGPRTAQAPRGITPSGEDGYAGIAEVGKPPSDFELRQNPDGDLALSFRLVDGRKGIKVVCTDPIASQLAALRASVIGQPVTCWGPIHVESFDKGTTTIKYNVLDLTKITTDDVTLPRPTGQVVTPDAAGAPSTGAEPQNPSASSLDAELDELGL